MNNTDKERIDALLASIGRDDLKNQIMYKRGYKFVLKILSMKEWENSKYARIMSQSIWNRSSEDIQNIFNWFKENNGKYDSLLSPVILSISFQNIKGNIQLYQEYGIDSYLKPACLRKNVKVQRLLLEYMKKNNIPFLINNVENTFQLNPILCATTATLKEKYGIDVKKLKNANRETFLK